jgi:hypothetical protein
LIDQIPKSVFNYYTKWSDFIAKDASSRCGIQVSGSDITIQHLTVYFASRGGKGSLGRKHSGDTRAKMSETRTGKKHSLDTRAKMSETRMGKKHSDDTRAKMSKTMTGKKRSTKSLK